MVEQFLYLTIFCTGWAHDTEFSLEKSGSFNNQENVFFFWQFLIFCKRSRNTNEKLMSYLESPVFFWSPCQISCPGKVWFIQKWAWNDPDSRDFSNFWPYWMNQYSKSTCVTKMNFWVLKEILEDYLPWKNKPQSLSGSWNMAASVFTLFEWSKKNCWKNFSFSLRIVQFVKITCLSDFWEVEFFTHGHTFIIVHSGWLENTKWDIWDGDEQYLHV